jgi:hypothetical protein
MNDEPEIARGVDAPLTPTSSLGVPPLEGARVPFEKTKHLHVGRPLFRPDRSRMIEDMRRRQAIREIREAAMDDRDAIAAQASRAEGGRIPHVDVMKSLGW